MSGQEHRAAIGTGREAVRDAVRERRQARREAQDAARERIREAQDAARERMREARATARESMREARAAGRASRTGAVTGGPMETDTRTRIQEIALELFTEQGYEATSLREIAERLGVTKAALYYHFKTKDDIIASVVEDRLARVEELISWAAEQPRSVETRREFLRRYADVLYDHGHHALMRFFDRNQSSMASHRVGILMKGRMVEMLGMLSNRDDALPDQIRSSLAIFALHSTWFVLRDPDITDDQRRSAALEVALGLVG